MEKETINELSFDAWIVKRGSSYTITVPYAFIKHKLLDKDKQVSCKLSNIHEVKN